MEEYYQFAMIQGHRKHRGELDQHCSLTPRGPSYENKGFDVLSSGRALGR